jgi:DUF2075 family protein/predicted GIY-YIG superfamily endonuclease
MSTGKNFSIESYSFDENLLKIIDSNYYLKDNWPIIYILSNEKNKLLYVGETSDFYTRMNTHLRNANKKQSSSIHIITSDKFNKSATLDIESNLIKYLSADKPWKLLNLNIGLSNHNYHLKEDRYWPLFEDIWEDLRARSIVHHTLNDITNSDLFKYSPFKSLNNEQYKGLLKIMEALLRDDLNIVLAEGGAGTGKSLLAIHLFKLLMMDIDEFNYRYFGHDEPFFIDLVRRLKEKYKHPNLALVIPMTSFRETIKKVFSNVKDLNASMVMGPTGVRNTRYDIILVDESHRLRRGVNLGRYAAIFDQISQALSFNKNKHTELDWLQKQSDKLILFYDEKQSVRPADVRPEDFKKLKSLLETEVQCLKKQMRVRGGEKYIKFVTDLLDCTLPPGTDKFSTNKYDFTLFDSVTEMRNQIQQRDRETGLSRMVAGYSWEWVSNKNPKLFDIELEGERYRWNSAPSDWINSKNALNEIGCIHTTQGYDLNFVGIIFGREITYDKTRNRIVILKENYFDKMGMISASDEELKGYIINVYRTVMQRAIKGAYVYAYHPELREYLRRFIPVAVSSNERRIANRSTP